MLCSGVLWWLRLLRLLLTRLTSLGCPLLDGAWALTLMEGGLGRGSGIAG